MRSRKNFLRAIAITAGVVTISSFFHSGSKKPSEKIKLLTPDGKLVEVSRDDIEREIISTRATNKEVEDWMNSKSKNS